MEQGDLFKLYGQLERITYQNEENDYLVGKVRVRGHSDLVTIIGNVPSPNLGEMLSMVGEWQNHPQFGAQFKVTFCSASAPTSIEGLKKYLGSGLIKGIGPVMAKRIVDRFGEETLEIIENSTNQLLKIPGIGQNRVQMIAAAWTEQKEIRNIMFFLQSHGISSNYASKIYRRYGNEAISVVQENPYRLAREVYGIGFAIADKIAQKMGISENSPQRVEAGIFYLLQSITEMGHVYCPLEVLIAQAKEILKVEDNVIQEATKSLEIEQQIVIEDLKKDNGIEQGVFLAGYHFAEKQIAALLKNIQIAERRIKNINADKAVEWICRQMDISLADKQIEAIRAAIDNKVLVITGGPGVGKTTITKAILQIFANVTNKILLAAPTGRAAKRMAEATGMEAKTIHRLLEFKGGDDGFLRNAEYQLNCDLVIVDEASMVDTLLMYHFLCAVPSYATVILVGDVQQLPSVGAGNVLKDIIDSGVIPVVSLNQIFRQAQQSRIIVNSHRIINGQMPEIDNYQQNSDFYFMQEEDPQKAISKIVLMVKERIPKKFGFNPLIDVQVLTPMNRGAIGAQVLNDALQENLNPNGFEIIKNGRKFRIGDKVMQIRNNYDKEVFNGDIGFILDIIPEDQTITVNIDGRDISYDYSELDELVLAYAISIHKSQGSEYPAVVIPLMTQHYVMLARNLVYTGITRGKKLVVVIGNIRAMSVAVQNNKTTERCTRLSERLKYLES